ncbi:MAG: UDP-N-acetylmuramate dehydrogenase [Legionellaceae bacterium]|nr:UDP-N-acetylmuramate dehydrogenase [Legionellaceae bacterium]
MRQEKEPSALRGKLSFNESLAKYTTWRVGGPAKVLYKPADIDDLQYFLQQLPANEPVLWLGLGSNCLIRDRGFSGTVIVTQHGLRHIQLLDRQNILVEAGVSCASMARFCARNHLSGGEFWAGIPGTMGGALRMNAGCHGGETWQWVQRVETINRQGVRSWHDASRFRVDYRQVDGLAHDEWFVAAICALPEGSKERALAEIKSLLAHRSDTQPTSDYNCGSVFRNPQGDYAARLIEQCGLKGFQIGNAQVSSKHANFIINQHGEASAADIAQLIQHVQHTVLTQTNIELTQEVLIIGEQ